MKMDYIRIGWVLLLATAAAGCSHSEVASPPSAPSAAASPLPVVAQEEKETPELAVVCRSGEEERRLELFKRDGGCALRYTKQGKSADVATSKSGTRHCKKALKKIKRRLKATGNHCVEQ